MTDAARERHRQILVDAIAIAALHAALCVGTRALGFDHVSDDDFARVTIAQAFAHAPKLDPSGTSWLPFPFWTLGTAMAVFGRSLGVAVAAGIAFSSLAVTAPYLALRAVDVPRGRALLAVAFAFGTPWCLWLGAAPVPESFTASLTAAAAIAIGATHPRTRALCGAAIALAALSRYEPWPAAAVLALVLGVRAARTARGRASFAVVAALCAAAPLLWMAWNAHAHDGPLHFFRRVSTFKRAIGAGATDTVGALLLYPRLLVTTRPEVAVPALFLLVPALRDQTMRRRWGVPLLCVAAQLAFLAYGNARDGAPAHHPERALLGPLVLLALFVADAGFAKLRELVDDGRGLGARGAAAAIAIAWVISSARGWDPPGRSASEDRSEAIARGLELRRAGVKAIAVTPCAYEHFALIAAFGAPERVRLEPRASIAHACPDVTVEH